MHSLSFQKNRVNRILKILAKEYPRPQTAINHSNPLELLVATILSAQCTDKRVNQVTPSLFKKYRTPQDYLQISPDELEGDIHSTGFYRNKAKNIRGACAMLIDKFGGQVPNSMEALTQLPGVGRKTANVLLGNIFGKNEGICVDTHMIRLSQRIGLSKNKTADKIEQDLMRVTSQKDWTLITNLLIPHGRNVCHARRPLCHTCVIKDECDFFEKTKN